MKKTRPQQKYSWLKRSAIAVNVLVAIVAIAILILVPISVRTISAEVPTSTEATMPTVEVVEETTAIAEEDFYDQVQVAVETTTATEEYVEVVEETIPATEPPYVPKIEDIENNISEWCLSSENEDAITIWKITDEEGNLITALKNNDDEFIVAFKYEGIESDYNEWILCDEFFYEITISDIIDYSFTSYHEVSGNNPENVQSQVGVLINRQNCDDYPNSIRGVVTDGGQYSCAKKVVNRRLKSSHYLEEKDLEKCFEQVILVLAGESIEDVPTNVVFAAPFPQGSGIWKIIDGTYYCYL